MLAVLLLSVSFAERFHTCTLRFSDGLFVGIRKSTEIGPLFGTSFVQSDGYVIVKLFVLSYVFVGADGVGLPTFDVQPVASTKKLITIQMRGTIFVLFIDHHLAKNQATLSEGVCNHNHMY
jgi:hypothetical protein